jgi:hypothetical protein
VKTYSHGPAISLDAEFGRSEADEQLSVMFASSGLSAALAGALLTAE